MPNAYLGSYCIITNLPPERADSQALLALTRSYWGTVEDDMSNLCEIARTSPLGTICLLILNIGFA